MLLTNIESERQLINIICRETFFCSPHSIHACFVCCMDWFIYDINSREREMEFLVIVIYHDFKPYLGYVN